jgi:hypothetical protein
LTLPEKQIEYKINLKEHLQELAINPDVSLGSRWNIITGAIHKTAEETLEKQVENNQMTGSTNNAKKPQK